MITWTKTETRTVERRCELWVRDGDKEEPAHEDHVLAAIEADEGLREEVRKAVDVRGSGDWQFLIDSANGTIDRLKQRLTAAESDRDAWKQRAERAEAAEIMLGIAEQRLTAIRGAIITATGCTEADIERRGFVTHIQEMDATVRRGRERAEKAEKERDEARAEVERIREQADRPCVTCATLRGMLADVKADLSLARQASEHWKRESERLEKELASAHDTDGQPWNMTTADAEELRARRALDRWEMEHEGNYLLRTEDGGVRATVSEDTDAPTHVELARKLGLIE